MAVPMPLARPRHPTLRQRSSLSPAPLQTRNLPSPFGYWSWWRYIPLAHSSIGSRTRPRPRTQKKAPEKPETRTQLMNKTPTFMPLISFAGYRVGFYSVHGGSLRHTRNSHSAHSYLHSTHMVHYLRQNCINTTMTHIPL